MATLRELGERLGGWPRRVLALCCLLLALATALTQRRPAPSTESTVRVVVAARDIRAGDLLTTSDLTIADWPRSSRPAGTTGAIADVTGRRVAGPIDAGDVVTDARLLGAGLTAGLPTSDVAVPVRLADRASSTLIRGGDQIDLLYAPASDSGPPAAAAVVVADGVRVLAVIPLTADATTGDDGTEIVVAVDRPTALRIASTAGQAITATVLVPT